MIRTVALTLCLSLVVGCASTTEVVDVDADTEVTVSYDASDIGASVAEIAQSLLASSRLKSLDREIPLVAIGKVTNDTCQHFNTSLITEKIAMVLLDSGRFNVTAAFADKASDRETMLGTVRTARDDAEFEATNVIGKGHLEVPDFSITGKILQRNVRRDNGGRRIEYFLSLSATRLSDGVVLWQSSARRIKSVADGMPVW